MKIMLDAGHGPNTPGKRSPDGMREFDFNSAVANAMKAELEQYEGVTVVFAHESTRDVPLKERTNKANTQKVDLYVSLHANANTGAMGNWTGIETYVYKTNPAEARKLADKVQKALVDATGLFNRGVKTADFHVLRETTMTSILIEHGYMDSHIDLPKLKDKGFRTLCGVTNAMAVAEVYGLVRKSPGYCEIVTGGVKPSGVAELSEFLTAKGWAFKVIGQNGIDPYFVIGWFGYDSGILSEMEAWLQARSWYYEKRKVG